MRVAEAHPGPAACLRTTVLLYQVITPTSRPTTSTNSSNSSTFNLRSPTASRRARSHFSVGRDALTIEASHRPQFASLGLARVGRAATLGVRGRRAGVDRHLHDDLHEDWRAGGSLPGATGSGFRIPGLHATTRLTCLTCDSRSTKHSWRQGERFRPPPRGYRGRPNHAHALDQRSDFARNLLSER